MICPACEGFDIHQVPSGIKDGKDIVGYQCFECSTRWTGTLYEWYELPEYHNFLSNPKVKATLKILFE